MHHDLSIGFACQMVVAGTHQLVAQSGIVRQLAIETKAEPLPLHQVMTLERLGVAAIFFTTGRVTDVADAGVPRILLHQLFARLAMGQAKDLGDRPELLVRIDELFAFWIVSRDSSSELPTILDIEQHSRQQPGSMLRAVGAQGAERGAGQVIHRGDAAFVVDIAHRESSSDIMSPAEI
jgi:hypothetical protein